MFLKASVAAFLTLALVFPIWARPEVYKIEVIEELQGTYYLYENEITTPCNNDSQDEDEDNSNTSKGNGKCQFNKVCHSNGVCACNLHGDYPVSHGNGCIKAVALGKLCVHSDQCSYVNANSYCNKERCACRQTHSEAFGINFRRICILRNVDTSRTKDIYKAAMVALACFMVTVIGLFILFLCNRSFMRRHRDERTNRTNVDGRRMSDVFNISENLAAMRLCDKPPTYDEVVRTDRMVRGVPPPEYREEPNVPATSIIAGLPMGNTVLAFFRRPNLVVGTHSGRNVTSNQEPRVLRLRTESVEVAEAPSSTGQLNRAFVSDA